MKKLICLILALMLSLAACGGDTGVTGTLEPESATAPKYAEEENDLSLGRMDGGVYTNEYVGFACQLDSNWSFLSAKELEQIPSTVSEAVSGSELGDALADVQQFTDMMAENVTDLTSMNVLYQKLSMQERLAYAALSEEQVIDSIIEQKDSMIAAYAQAGIAVSAMEKVTVTFLGQERIAIHTTATVENVPYFVLQFFDFDLGAYSVTTTLSSYIEDQTAALTELFYPVD